MKTFQLRDDVWVELKSIDPTQEEIEILNNDDESLFEQKKSILSKLNFTENASDEDALKLNEVYNEIMPDRGESYKLLGIDVTIDGDDCRGILNYTINNNHEQIRFNT